MIEKTSEATKLAILRKTPFAHGDRPGDDGMPAAQVKKMFYTAIADEQNSVLSEMERMRTEANASLDTKVDLARITDDVVRDADSAHIPSVQGLLRYVDRVGNAYRYYFTDITIVPADWHQLDVAVGDYRYAATIPLPHVTAATIAEVYFAPAALARKQLATFCRTTAGAVEVYTNQPFDVPIGVEAIACWVPTFYTVMVDAPHAQVTVTDAAGHNYAHGDSVAAGASLSVSVRTEEGYTAQGYTLNGTSHAMDAEGTVTVQGSVWVVCDTTPAGGDA